MPYGGILPYKTDGVTPLVADIIEAGDDYIKFIHESMNLGVDTEKSMYWSALLDALGIEDDFFNYGTTLYPVFNYDQVNTTFATTFFKLDSFEKIMAILSAFNLFSRRDVDRQRIMETYFTVWQSYSEKLQANTYEQSGTVFKMKFNLLTPSVLSATDNAYKFMVQEYIYRFLGINLNVAEYLSWITYELLPVGSPTEFVLGFDITTDERMALAQKIATLLDTEQCFNVYDLLYHVCESIIAWS